MVSIIENQHIAKRHKPLSRPNNKSAGFNTGFMSQFNQKPAHTGKHTRTKNIRRTQTPYGKHKEELSERTRKSGFSFPVPSAATLAVAAGTIIIALTALKWDDINIKIPENYIFNTITSEDTGANIRISNYAITGIPGITADLQLPEIKQTVNGEAAIIAAARVEEAAPAAENSISGETGEEPHGLLVTFEWQNYRVQKGDSVTAIARKFGVSIGAIIASNEIRNARRLQEGAELRIPNIDGIPYSIKKGDSLSKISASFNVPLEVILDVNDIKNDTIMTGETIFIPGARMNDMDLRSSLGDLFIYPVQVKYITSSYGMRKDPINGRLVFHNGIDIRSNKGAAVMASLDGTVSVVGENWLYGKYIIISHGNGYKTLYAHLSAQSVKQGDRVPQGRKIGEVGSTGHSTGPHLHFGIYDKKGNLVNPLDLLS